MYNQGLDMSPDDIMATRPNRIGKGRTYSTGLKRTQGGQSIETVEFIQNAIEYSNDQLKAIA